MGFNKKTWKDRKVEYPGRRKIVTISDQIFDVTRAEGIAAEQGDAFNAGNMNELETRIDTGIKDTETKLTTRIDTVEYQTNTKIDTVEYQLTNNINSVNTNLTNSINNIPKVQFETNVNNLKSSSLTASLGIVNNTVKSDHSHPLSSSLTDNYFRSYESLQIIRNQPNDSDELLYTNGFGQRGLHIVINHSALTTSVQFSDYIHKNTTTTSPNACIISGYLQISTSSSKRYKNHISDIKNEELNPDKILEIPVRQYRFNEGYVSDDPKAHEVDRIGFIVEEIEKIYPQAVDYEDGKPEMWNYKVMIPAMLAVIQKQEKRINDLESRIAKLEGK